MEKRSHKQKLLGIQIFHSALLFPRASFHFVIILPFLFQAELLKACQYSSVKGPSRPEDLSSSRSLKMNKLGQEKSPYLLQHAGNPVNWYPWGEEAFQAARESNKLIFLSVGYSTCHWCHVMERESFESQEVR